MPIGSYCSPKYPSNPPPPTAHSLNTPRPTQKLAPHFENYDEESEVFGCNRCSLMMSIIDDRLSSFFSELTNKIKQVEVRLEGLDVLASNVEEMKKVLKTALDRLETTDLKEVGAGGKKRKRPSALLQRRP